MKISEFINVPKESKDTTSCGTTYSGQKADLAQDIVPQNIVPENIMAPEVDSEIESHPDHSAITEGVSQIFRRQKGGKPTKGFRCTSGPRKGRIVAKPSTCFAQTGVSQIFRRQKGGKPTKGFRCTSGPRKGRIVAKPSTCFAKTDPVKSAKIRKKRQQKARVAGKKMAMTKRSGGGSKRLAGVQIKKKSMKGKSVAPRMKARASKRLAGVQIKKKSMKGKSVAPRMKARAPVKSRVLKPKKR